MSTHWKPANWPTVVTVLPGGSRLVQFLMKVFEAQPLRVFELEGNDKKVARAEVRIGDSLILTGDAPAGKASPAGSMLVYVADCDAVYARALAAGATAKEAPQDQFFGDRTARVSDAFGNTWAIATHKEDVSAEEIGRRTRG